MPITETSVWENLRTSGGVQYSDTLRDSTSSVDGDDGTLTFQPLARIDSRQLVGEIISNKCTLVLCFSVSNLHLLEITSSVSFLLEPVQNLIAKKWTEETKVTGKDLNLKLLHP